MNTKAKKSLQEIIYVLILLLAIIVLFSGIPHKIVPVWKNEIKLTLPTQHK